MGGVKCSLFLLGLSLAVVFGRGFQYPKPSGNKSWGSRYLAKGHHSNSFRYPVFRPFYSLFPRKQYSMPPRYTGHLPSFKRPNYSSLKMTEYQPTFKYSNLKPAFRRLPIIKNRKSKYGYGNPIFRTKLTKSMKPSMYQITMNMLAGIHRRQQYNNMLLKKLLGRRQIVPAKAGQTIALFANEDEDETHLRVQTHGSQKVHIKTGKDLASSTGLDIHPDGSVSIGQDIISLLGGDVSSDFDGVVPAASMSQKTLKSAVPVASKGKGHLVSIGTASTADTETLDVSNSFDINKDSDKDLEVKKVVAKTVKAVPIVKAGEDKSVDISTEKKVEISDSKVLVNSPSTVDKKAVVATAVKSGVTIVNDAVSKTDSSKSDVKTSISDSTVVINSPDVKKTVVPDPVVATAVKSDVTIVNDAVSKIDGSKSDVKTSISDSTVVINSPDVKKTVVPNPVAEVVPEPKAETIAVAPEPKPKIVAVANVIPEPKAERVIH